MPKLILMDHDGAIDDLLSQLLVLTMPDAELIGVTVTPGAVQAVDTYFIYQLTVC